MASYVDAWPLISTHCSQAESAEAVQLDPGRLIGCSESKARSAVAEVPRC